MKSSLMTGRDNVFFRDTGASMTNADKIIKLLIGGIQKKRVD